MPPTISLCMIAKNEAQALPRALGAVRPFVDEIVVVDTGSTDETAAIAAAHGARVIHWAWRDDFAAARNESLRHATGDWILVLDADEELDESSGEALRRAVAGAPNTVAAFLIKIVCPRGDDGGMVRLNWFPRLFRRLPGVAFEGVIHEQIVGTISPHGDIVPSQVVALHAGYTITPEQMRAKGERNLRLLERQLHDDPSYAPGWFQLAETYVLLGRLDEGIDGYRRCLRLLESSRLTLPPSVTAVALQNMGAALIQRGDRDAGVTALRCALEIDPDLVPSHVHLGSAAMAAGEWPQAERHFADALDAAERTREESEYEISPWLIHFLRGAAVARQSRLDEARSAFEAALALRPDHTDSLWLLALTHAEARHWAGCWDALERLGALGRDDFPFHTECAVALTGLGRHDEAAAAAARALERDATSVPVLGLHAEALYRGKRFGEAADAYEALLASDPGAIPARLALAQCYEAVGDPERMMAAYAQAVELAPDSADVLFALGSACLRGGALDAALECLGGAVERAPGRADYRINHALCLIKLGALDDAQAAVRELARTWPQVAEIRQLQDLLDRLAPHHAASRERA